MQCGDNVKRCNKVDSGHWMETLGVTLCTLLKDFVNNVLGHMIF